ncbi:tetratricopeptide repeat protein [Lysobacter sp. P5_B9]
MKDQDVLTSGADGLIPQADAARQAIDSLRGYAYQVTAAALAWLDVEATSKIYLEVAEDYAVVAKDAISAVQVKDTQASGKVTLNTDSVREAILNFVKLTASNAGVDVHLRYFTTSDIGTEKTLQDRPGGSPGLVYWRRAAKGADVKPLREILDSDKFAKAVREFVRSRGDDELRRDLFRKIHWECGKPDLASLRKEFRDRLVVVGRDTFGIPAPDALQISNLLLHHVLEKSIGDSPADRVLTRADLIAFIDSASRVSVPIAVMDVFAKASSGLLAQMLGGSAAGLPVALGLPSWLVDGSDLPASKRAVPRPEIEKGIEDRLRTFGACFVAGASGVGKSSVSRAVAERVGENYFVVDFRGASTEETRSRLDAFLSRLGGIHAPVVILEDLNQFNDPNLAALSARLFEALNRRDIAVIVTSYAAPTPKALSNVGQNPGCSIDCPYFSEEESARLVELHGGDASFWGKLAHVSGAFGHPQLVHAFIAGMAARGWPRSEIPAIVSAGLSTGDIAAEREAARRSLISVLPEGARNLLYRLSLTIGTFNRGAALSIATAPPPIVQAGEALDSLIGPWIETMGRDSYRISPLADKSGQEMLIPDEQQAIHGKIASQLMSGRTVDAGDIDKIILHAMLGKNEEVLVSLTSKLLTSGDKVINFLAESLALLRVFDTEKLIYPDNVYISSMLRLVQFKVLAAGQDKGSIAKCVRALLKESEQLKRGESRDMFQMLSLGKILGTMGIANYLDNWVELLLRFHAIATGNEFSRRLLANLEAKPGMGSSTVGVLFAIGGSNLASVAKLEHVFAQLDEIGPEQRAMLLRPIEEHTSDFSVLINSPWVAEQDNGLNALDAAERYRRMAAQTSSWGFRSLTIQCWIARAVMLDEYASDFEGALKVLDDAVIENGEDVLISRARAKVYWRAGNHERALTILRGIADEVGKNNNVERAFALREAAISAAICNDWGQAEEWFLEAKISASKAKLPDMKAMSVGLGADAAVAAFKTGKVERCLRGLAEGLIALGRIRPESALRCAHCHHLLRHTVLWLQSTMAGRVVVLGGETISMRPGICSNPEPVKEIADRPLGSIDIAWYMLAEAELMSRKAVGILDGLYDRLSDGPIPMLEISLRSKRLEIDIEDMNPDGFVRHLLGHIEGIAYLSDHVEEFRRDFDVLNPERKAIPAIALSDVSSKHDHLANDAVFAYAISCACRQAPDALLELFAALDSCFGPGVIGGDIFSRARSGSDRLPPASFEDVLIDNAMAFRNDVPATPRDYLLAGVRFLQQAQRSSFRASLVPIISAWQRSAWSRIVESEAFRLSRPQRTVPVIKHALSLTTNDESFLCALILAAADATDVALPREVRAGFERLASREDA